VSGWHDTGNVTDVQIYDTKAKRWEKGTPWPGTPVFGHAGGLVGDVMAVCDGVTAGKDESGKNRYAITNACWQGKLDVQAPGNIDWRQISPHPGVPLYRAGATGAKDRQGNSRVVFAGGTPRPYNYNGIGYDHVPAEPSSAVFAFDPARHVWTSYQSAPKAGMDFRGLIAFDDTFILFGGMDANQAVTNQVVRFSLQAASSSK
jgi:hypothetical protein